MSCINPQNPEFKAILSDINNPLLAEIELENRIQEEGDAENRKQELISDVDKAFPDEDMLTIGQEVYNQSSQKRTWANEAITKLAQKFTEKLGVESELIDDSTAYKLLSKTTTPYQGEPSFFYAGKVYVVNGKATPKNVVHEFIHPVIKAISKTNKGLFYKLYTSLSDSPEGVAIIDFVTKKYTDLDSTSDRFKEECLVRSLETDVLDKVQNTTRSTGFKEFIKNLLYSIKQVLREVFGKVKVEKLDSNTTLKELADMIAGESFQLNTQLISESDFAEYVKDIQDFRKEIESLKKVKSLQAIIDKAHGFTSVVGSKLERTTLDKIDLLNIQQNKMDLAKLKSNSTEYENRENDLNAYHYNQASTLISSLAGIEATLDRINPKLELLLTKTDFNQNDVSQATSFMESVKAWDKFLKEINADIGEAVKDINQPEVVSTVIQPIRNYINELGDLVTDSINKIKDINKKAVVKVSYDNASQMANAVNEMMNLEKKNAIAKGASPAIISEIENKYKNLQITEDSILKIIEGTSGDISFLNAYFESYLNSNDPIIGGFATYLKSII